jgi:hypothetical protein
MVEQPMFGTLVAASFVVVHIPRQGWNVTVRRTWDWSKPGAPEVEYYDRLSRGEMLDVLLALRELLDVGTEY